MNMRDKLLRLKELAEQLRSCSMSSSAQVRVQSMRETIDEMLQPAAPQQQMKKDHANGNWSS